MKNNLEWMADDKLHIRLHVYDTELSVNIPREDEEYYRAASKLITDTVNTYATYFKGKKSDKDIFIYGNVRHCTSL